MIDKRGREYLKTSKPAPIHGPERNARAEFRIELRKMIKKMGWRSFRKWHRATRNLSFARRLRFMNAVLKGAKA
jgi:hypothetical protein